MYKLVLLTQILFWKAIGKTNLIPFKFKAISITIARPDAVQSTVAPYFLKRNCRDVILKTLYWFKHSSMMTNLVFV